MLKYAIILSFFALQSFSQHVTDANNTCGFKKLAPWLFERRLKPVNITCFVRQSANCVLQSKVECNHGYLPEGSVKTSAIRCDKDNGFSLQSDLKCVAGCAMFDLSDKNQLGNATIVNGVKGSDGFYSKGTVVETKCKDGHLFDTPEKRNAGTDKHRCVGGREGWVNLLNASDVNSRPGLCKPVCEITPKLTEKLKPVIAYDHCDVMDHKMKKFLVMGNPFLYELENGTQTNMLTCPVPSGPKPSPLPPKTPPFPHKGPNATPSPVASSYPVINVTLAPPNPLIVNVNIQPIIVNPVVFPITINVNYYQPTIPGIYLNITPTGVVIPFTIVDTYKLPGIYIPIVGNNIINIQIPIRYYIGISYIVLPLASTVVFEELTPETWIQFVLDYREFLYDSWGKQCKLTEKLKPVIAYDHCDVMDHKMKKFLVMGNPFLYELENGTQTNMLTCPVPSGPKPSPLPPKTPPFPHKGPNATPSPVASSYPVINVTLAPPNPLIVNVNIQPIIVNPVVFPITINVNYYQPTIPGIYLNITPTGVVIPFTIVDTYKLPGIYIPIVGNNIINIQIPIRYYIGISYIVLPLASTVVFEELTPETWIQFVLDYPNFNMTTTSTRPSNIQYLFIPLLPPNLGFPNTIFIPLNLTLSIPMITIPFLNIPHQPNVKLPTLTVPVVTQSPSYIVINYNIGQIPFYVPDISNLPSVIPVFGRQGCKKFVDSEHKVMMTQNCEGHDMYNAGCKITIKCESTIRRHLQCSSVNGIAGYTDESGFPILDFKCPSQTKEKTSVVYVTQEAKVVYVPQKAEESCVMLPKRAGWKILLVNESSGGKCKNGEILQPKGCEVRVKCRKGYTPANSDSPYPVSCVCNGQRFVDGFGEIPRLECRKDDSSRTVIIESESEKRSCEPITTEESSTYKFSNASHTTTYSYGQSVQMVCKEGYYPSNEEYQKSGFQLLTCGSNGHWESGSKSSAKWEFHCTKGCINRPHEPLRESEVAYKVRTFKSKKSGKTVSCRKEIAREFAQIKYTVPEMPFHCKPGESQDKAYSMQKQENIPCTNACLDILDDTDTRSINVKSKKSKISWEGDSYVMDGHVFTYTCKNP
uniref:Sushi domain-containing protein n=1 Tax=Bursaphelenchus xylophilus TaxID=6326 RepID=A0A1I7SEX2_BURXY